MKILLTAGPTWEAVDAVRYIANRSSGRMGLALTAAAMRAGHGVTAIVGPGVGAVPAGVRRLEVQSARQMYEGVMSEFPSHDVLIMAAAVADYRPKRVVKGKLPRDASLVIEFEATEDIVAAAVGMRRVGQIVVAFSLEEPGQIGRAEEKMGRKGVDLMVYNPIRTMNSEQVEAVLLWPGGRREVLGCRGKGAFADVLLERIGEMNREDSKT
jgi:phosphopantothenoylcysteine decarboxylase/phosphopantothenate--cysteine ligase